MKGRVDSMESKKVYVSMLSLMMVASVVLHNTGLIGGGLLIASLAGSSILIFLNYKEMQEIKKKKIESLMRLASEMVEENQPHTARQICQKILELHPGERKAMAVISGDGQQPASLQDSMTEQARKITPNHLGHEHYFRLGMAHLRARHIGPAIRAFRKVQELCPEHGDTYYFMGRAYQAAGNIAKAIGNFRVYLVVGQKASLKKEAAQLIEELSSVQVANAPVPYEIPDADTAIMDAGGQEQEEPSPIEIQPAPQAAAMPGPAPDKEPVAGIAVPITFRTVTMEVPIQARKTRRLRVTAREVEVEQRNVMLMTDNDDLMKSVMESLNRKKQERKGERMGFYPAA
jgi:hypothetical protein